MAIAAGKRDDMVLLKDDLEEATDRILDVTEGLRVVFRSVGESDMVTVADKVVRFLEGKGSATFKQIMGTMWKDCTKAELEVIMATLAEAGILQEIRIGQSTTFKLIQKVTKTKARAKGATP
jgi:hypothetical protein